MRKRPVPTFVCLVAAVTTAGVVVSCGPADSRAPLVVYSPHGKEMLSHYEAAFEEAYPAIDVQWIDMGGQNAEDRIRTESANPQASVWWGGAGMAFDRAAREGLLAPYRPSWASSVLSDARGPSDLWYGTFFTPEVIAYNSVALDSARSPRGWDELLAEKWRGRVLLRYPLASSTMRTIFGAMILRQPTVEDGYRWLAKLDRNVKTYTADPTQLYLKLARGEGDVTVWNLPDIFLQADVNGYPFAFVIPEHGTPVLVDGIALVHKGPNIEAAQLFYEFVTSDSALVHQAEAFYRIPVRTDVPASRLPAWVAGLNVNPMKLDWERLATEGPTWMQFWDENIKGRGSEYLAEVGS
ncbi:MAG: extracellular solute-binding protein [Rhodothermales bacterium]|nr:extracellular solute-binding protein [Rhodothermales bacterium]